MKHKIQQVRQEKGITQKELAERLNITRQGVSSIENSDSVTLNTLEKVANAFGCYIHELIDDSGETFEADSPEEYEAIRQSLLNNIDDLRREKDEYFRERLNELLPKLNSQGQLLLVKLAGALCSTSCLLKEGETSILDDVDETEEKI